MQRMDIAEFQSAGYLQEVNRQVLHPLGLALAVVTEDDGSAHLEAVLDGRDDPEGWVMSGGEEDLAAKAATIATEWERRRPAREAALGFMVQPAE